MWVDGYPFAKKNSEEADREATHDVDGERSPREGLPAGPMDKMREGVPAKRTSAACKGNHEHRLQPGPSKVKQNTGAAALDNPFKANAAFITAGRILA